MRLPFAVALVFGLSVATAQAQTGVGYIVGFVRDSDRSEFGAAVRIDSVRGDLPGVEAGRFVLAVPSGRHTLRFLSLTEKPFVSAPIDVRAGARSRKVYLGCHAPGVSRTGATCAEGRVLGAVNADASGMEVVGDQRTWEQLLSRSSETHPLAVDWAREMVIVAHGGAGMTYTDMLPDLTVNRVIYTPDSVTVVLGADSVIVRHSNAEGIWVGGATAIPRSSAKVVFQFLPR